MRLEFVTNKLNDAYADRDSLNQKIKDYDSQLYKLEEERSLLNLVIKNLQVLLREPFGVKITPVGFPEAPIEAEKTEKASTPASPAKKAAKKR